MHPWWMVVMAVMVTIGALAETISDHDRHWVLRALWTGTVIIWFVEVVPILLTHGH